MLCRKCGAELSIHSQYCDRCGASTDFSKFYEENPPRRDYNYRAAQKKSLALDKLRGMLKSESSATRPKRKTADNSIKWLITLVVLTVVFTATLFLIINSRYNNAVSLLEDNLPEQARYEFVSVSWYRDAREKIEVCDNMITYDKAKDLMENDSLTEARELFLSLGTFRDSKELADECQTKNKYNYSIALMNLGEYEMALESFNSLGSFYDSEDLAAQCKKELSYEKAVTLMDEGSYYEASRMFENLNLFKNSYEFFKECQNHIVYDNAVNEYNNGNIYEAYMLFDSLGDFLDAASLKDDCILPTPPSKELYSNPDFPNRYSTVKVVAPASNHRAHAYMKVYSEDGELVSTLFIRSGESLVFFMPQGTYTVKAGYGWDWFGEDIAFGDDAQYKVLVFGDGVESMTLRKYYTYTITLLPDVRGNTGGRDEDLDDF